MIKGVLVLIIFSFTCKLNAQNLVANGGLNDRNRCTERNALCAPEAWFYIPAYITVPQEKEDNDFCEVLSMGTVSTPSPAARTYFYTKILCTLKTGKRYKFSIWVNTADNAFDHLDIWLCANEPDPRTQSISLMEPAFTITLTEEDSSKPNWKKYSYEYTAKGVEHFLMLGNLSAKAMDKSKVTALSKKGTVLYAIDDIMLTAIDSTERVCREYQAVLKQVYDQNDRHPARLIEDIKLDETLIAKDTAPGKKEIVWVIVDTPPSLLKTLNDTLTIPDVLFLYNSSKLNPAFIRDLNNMVGKLKEKPFKGIEVTGHTDNKGTTAYNLQLSADRAIAIKDYLLTRLSLSNETVTIKGMGETNPVASNETAEGRQRNRRVEIIVKH